MELVPPAWDAPSLPSSPASSLLALQHPWAGGQQAAGDSRRLPSPRASVQRGDTSDAERNDSLQSNPELILALIAYAIGWLNSGKPRQIHKP